MIHSKAFPLKGKWKRMVLLSSLQMSCPLWPPPKDGNPSPQKILFPLWMLASWMYIYFSFNHVIVLISFWPGFCWWTADENYHYSICYQKMAVMNLSCFHFSTTCYYHRNFYKYEKETPYILGKVRLDSVPKRFPQSLSPSFIDRSAFSFNHLQRSL